MLHYSDGFVPSNQSPRGDPSKALATVDPADAFARLIVVPALVDGPRAAKRFANFFRSIANDNTRAAYQRACLCVVR